MNNQKSQQSTATEAAGSSMHFTNLRMPTVLVTDLDEIARQQHCRRSVLIRQGCQMLIDAYHRRAAVTPASDTHS
ncbi:MAG: hypothetical protein ACRYFS_15310 [Janthinobacterium lividum]